MDDERHQMKAVRFAFDTLPVLSSLAVAVLISAWGFACLVVLLIAFIAVGGMVDSGLPGAAAGAVIICATGLAAVVSTEKLTNCTCELLTRFHRRIEQRVMKDIDA